MGLNVLSIGFKLADTIIPCPLAVSTFLLLERPFYEGLEESLKGCQLFFGEQLDVPFVIQQKGTDTDDSPCQITSTFNCSLDLIPLFAY